MSKLLFDEEGSDEEAGFKTNKDYAKSYNKYRQKELLKKCKCFSLKIGDFVADKTDKRVDISSER